MSNTSQNKTHATDASVEAFIQTVKSEQKKQDAWQLIEVMKKISNEPPVMWGPSIIGFGLCHYKYESGREGDMGMLGFSPRASDLTVYLVDGMSKYVNDLQQLGPHRLGKVCLYIKKLSDVDMAVLEHILTKSYQFALANKANMPRAE